MKDKDFEERLRSLSKMYVLRRDVKKRIMNEVRRVNLTSKVSLGVIFTVLILLIFLIVLIILVPSPSYLTDSSYLINESEFVERILLYIENIELFQWMLVHMLLYLVLGFLGLFSLIMLNKIHVLKGGRK